MKIEKLISFFGALLCCAFLLVSPVYAQSGVAKGVVLGDDGQPAVGAAVMVKGTTNGTSTDGTGAFSLSGVKTGDVLAISSIGYVATEVTWKGQPLNVVLAVDAEMLDDVVVTALGMKRSTKALGYAMTELKSDEINTEVINPVAALQGKVAGVEVNQSDGGMFGHNKILIRGASTLSSNNQPIYVIDGIILDNTVNEGSADWDSNNYDYGNELKNLNPDDFESISVLKGAAATALYGSRGLNGAVVITTKSGKGKKGIGVTFKQTFGVDVVTSQPTLQNVYMEGLFSGYGEYMETTRYDVHNAKIYADAGNYPSLLKMYRDYGVTECSFGNRFADFDKIEWFDGSVIASEARANNMKEAYNAGFNTNTNIALSGSTEKSDFYLSLSEKYATGTLPNNSFNRFSALAKASHRFNDVVDMEFSANFTKSTPRNSQPNIGEYFISGTFDRTYDAKYFRDKYKGEHGGIAQEQYGDKWGSIPGRSLWWSIYENNSYQNETVFRPDAKLTIKFAPWLKWVSQASYNYYGTAYESKQPGSGYANEGGYYQLSNTVKQQLNLNTNFFFDFDLGEDWTLSGFVRGEYFNTTQTYLKEETSGGLVIPNQYFLSNSKNGIQSTGNISGTKRILSIAGQISASWRNQLFLDVTGRNDWSSSLVYADGHGNYSYFYPSVSGSWVMSETFDLPKWITFLKLRASLAQVGNDTDAYRINSAYSLSTSTKDGNKVYSLSIPSSAYDNNLKPERKTSWEVGVDWRVLNGRIGIDATYYKENTRDQIMSVSVPSVSGVSSALINAGNIQNSGVEIALNTIPVETKNFKWDLNFTFTKNNSKIVELSDLVADHINLMGNADYGNYRIGSVAKVGGTYGMLMSDSAPKVDETSGLPVLSYSESYGTARYTRSGVQEVVGNSTPDFLGGISTTFTFKNWSLYIGLDGRFGGYVASYGSRYGTAYGYTETSLKGADAAHGGIEYTSRLDGIRYDDGIVVDGIFPTGTNLPQGDGTYYTVGTGKYTTGETYAELLAANKIDPSHASSFQYYQNSWGAGVINDSWFTKLNYIALRDVALTYSFNQRAAKAIGAQGLSLKLAGHNLGYLLNTMPNKENPESIRGTSASEFRVRSFDCVTSAFTFTINASF